MIYSSDYYGGCLPQQIKRINAKYTLPVISAPLVFTCSSYPNSVASWTRRSGHIKHVRVLVTDFKHLFELLHKYQQADFFVRFCLCSFLSFHLIHSRHTTSFEKLRQCMCTCDANLVDVDACCTQRTSDAGGGQFGGISLPHESVLLKERGEGKSTTFYSWHEKSSARGSIVYLTSNRSLVWFWEETHIPMVLHQEWQDYPLWIRV